MLRRLAPDLVLTDVAYLPLAGAAQAGIPALSMCSLTWADLPKAPKTAAPLPQPVAASARNGAKLMDASNMKANA